MRAPVRQARGRLRGHAAARRVPHLPLDLRRGGGGRRGDRGGHVWPRRGGRARGPARQLPVRLWLHVRRQARQRQHRLRAHRRERRLGGLPLPVPAAHVPACPPHFPRARAGPQGVPLLRQGRQHGRQPRGARRRHRHVGGGPRVLERGERRVRVRRGPRGPVRRARHDREQDGHLHRRRGHHERAAGGRGGVEHLGARRGHGGHAGRRLQLLRVRGAWGHIVDQRARGGLRDALASDPRVVMGRALAARVPPSARSAHTATRHRRCE
mmetsp:Transcript_3862/g.13307  ORF Transcript_3862/g.13307 Transcript_3862/m.13307 type:complete len:268 (+) Transcript_3862:299-1102(+)